MEDNNIQTKTDSLKNDEIKNENSETKTNKKSFYKFKKNNNTNFNAKNKTNHQNNNYKKNKNNYIDKQIDYNDDTIVINENEKTEQEILKFQIFNFIKYKTGRDINLFRSNLFKISKYEKEYNLSTNSNTNLLGFCILYDDFSTFKFLTNEINNIELPKISNNFIINIIFNKSFELNQEIINLFNSRNQINELQNMFLNDAPKYLYRSETINIYLTNVLYNCQLSDIKKFIDDIFKENNKPIIYEMTKNIKYKNFINSYLDDNKKNIQNDVYIWAKNLCQNTISSSIKKDEIKQKTSNNNLSAHISDSAAKVIMLKSDETKEPNIINKTKKKVLNNKNTI